MAGRDYDEILARNVRGARSRADLSQEDLAERMRWLGFPVWLRQTVSNTERAKRGLSAKEVFGLSVSLEVSIVSLMLPAPDDSPLATLPAGQLVALPKQGFAPASVSGQMLWDGNSPKFAAPLTGPAAAEDSEE